MQRVPGRGAAATTSSRCRRTTASSGCGAPSSLGVDPSVRLAGIQERAVSRKPGYMRRAWDRLVHRRR